MDNITGNPRRVLIYNSQGDAHEYDQDNKFSVKDFLEKIKADEKYTNLTSEDQEKVDAAVSNVLVKLDFGTEDGRLNEEKKIGPGWYKEINEALAPVFAYIKGKNKIMELKISPEEDKGRCDSKEFYFERAITKEKNFDNVRKELVSSRRKIFEEYKKKYQEAKQKLEKDKSDEAKQELESLHNDFIRELYESDSEYHNRYAKELYKVKNGEAFKGTEVGLQVAVATEFYGSFNALFQEHKNPFTLDETKEQDFLSKLDEVNNEDYDACQKQLTENREELEKLIKLDKAFDDLMDGLAGANDKPGLLKAVVKFLAETIKYSNVFNLEFLNTCVRALEAWVFTNINSPAGALEVVQFCINEIENIQNKDAIIKEAVVDSYIPFIKKLKIAPQTMLGFAEKHFKCIKNGDGDLESSKYLAVKYTELALDNCYNKAAKKQVFNQIFSGCSKPIEGTRITEEQNANLSNFLISSLYPSLEEDNKKLFHEALQHKYNDEVMKVAEKEGKKNKFAEDTTTLKNSIWFIKYREFCKTYKKACHSSYPELKNIALSETNNKETHIEKIVEAVPIPVDISLFALLLYPLEEKDKNQFLLGCIESISKRSPKKWNRGQIQSNLEKFPKFKTIWKSGECSDDDKILLWALISNFEAYKKSFTKFDPPTYSNEEIND